MSDLRRQRGLSLPPAAPNRTPSDRAGLGNRTRVTIATTESDVERQLLDLEEAAELRRQYRAHREDMQRLERLEREGRQRMEERQAEEEMAGSEDLEWDLAEDLAGRARRRNQSRLHFRIEAAAARAQDRLRQSSGCEASTCAEEATFVHSQGILGCMSTIQHWQLRDLVATGDNENEVFWVQGHHTLRYNTATKREDYVQELAFSPTSMTVGYGYMAAGGHNSQLEVTELDTGETVFKGHLGGSVNNALHFGRDAGGEVQLFVCNNDETVKVFSPVKGDLVASIPCPAAINYAALSPDGRTLVCVGDSYQTYLFTATSTGFTRSTTFTEARDAGMSCAWNAAGTCFAAASQDGRLNVWEHRSGKVIAQFRTRGACRGVKFSAGGVDLLAFTEHENMCHVVDARMYSSRQELCCSPAASPGPRDPGLAGLGSINAQGGQDFHVSGLAFSPSSQRLYVGLEELGIARYDVDMLSRVSFPIGQLR